MADGGGRVIEHHGTFRDVVVPLLLIAFIAVVGSAAGWVTRFGDENPRVFIAAAFATLVGAALLLYAFFGGDLR